MSSPHATSTHRTCRRTNAEEAAFFDTHSFNMRSKTPNMTVFMLFISMLTIDTYFKRPNPDQSSSAPAKKSKECHATCDDHHASAGDKENLVSIEIVRCCTRQKCRHAHTLQNCCRVYASAPPPVCLADKVSCVRCSRLRPPRRPTPAPSVDTAKKQVGSTNEGGRTGRNVETGSNPDASSVQRATGSCERNATSKQSRYVGISCRTEVLKRPSITDLAGNRTV